MTSAKARIGDDDFYDAELRRHNPHFRAATGIRPGDRVVDIGCGTGQATREAARATTASGSVLGVDTSAPMLDRARELTAGEGLGHVTYRQADAGSHRFPPRGFDVAISRFGSMFFTDPVAAFANIGRGLRPGGRLVLMVWQERDRNEWCTAVRRTLAPDAGPADAPAPGTDAFSLADPAVTRRILTEAGFHRIAFTDVHEPVYYGPDQTVAYDTVLCLREPRDLLAGLDDAAARRARDRLRALLAAHRTAEGVFFDARTWLVTAHRR